MGYCYEKTFRSQNPHNFRYSIWEKIEGIGTKNEVISFVGKSFTQCFAGGDKLTTVPRFPTGLDKIFRTALPEVNSYQIGFRVQSACQPSRKKSIGTSKVKYVPATAEIDIIEYKISNIIFVCGVVSYESSGFNMPFNIDEYLCISFHRMNP